MRVITGSARGHNLKAPKGENTRPTSDRIKESLFSIIGIIDDESTVLDLFSGSGGIGIEFLSRGAKFSYFIDSEIESINIIKENLEKTKLAEKSLVYKNSVDKAIKSLGNKHIEFDYIFLDPPYNKELVIKTLENIENENLLRNNGVIIIEHETKLELPERTFNLLKTDYRKYGDTSISFYRNEEV